MLVPHEPKETQFEIDFKDYHTQKGTKSFGEKVDCYLQLCLGVFIVLGLGWLWFIYSVLTCFKPDSAGAIMVAAGVIAETILLAYHWQKIPAQLGGGTLRIWKDTASSLERTVITYNNHNIYNEESIVLFAMYPLLSLSKSQHKTGFSRFIRWRAPVDGEYEEDGHWDISMTTSHVSRIVNIYIAATVFIGTVIWGYFHEITSLCT